MNLKLRVLNYGFNKRENATPIRYKNNEKNLPKKTYLMLWGSLIKWWGLSPHRSSEKMVKSSSKQNAQGFTSASSLLPSQSTNQLDQPRQRTIVYERQKMKE